MLRATLGGDCVTVIGNDLCPWQWSERWLPSTMSDGQPQCYDLDLGSSNGLLSRPMIRHLALLPQ